jgi:hypothetical protein
MAQAPAVHIRREYEPPPTLRQAIGRYMRLVRHYDHHGTDPKRVYQRELMLKGGPVRISPIAWTDGPLEIDRVAIDNRRRVWRFRACVMETGRCIFEQFVEAETREEGCKVGAQFMTRDWHKVLAATNGRPPAAVVATVLAI